MRKFYAILTLVFAACLFTRSATITGPVYLAYSNRPYSGKILLRPVSTPLPNSPNLITGGDFTVSTDTNGLFSVDLQPGNYRVTVGADKAFVIDVPNDSDTYTLLSRITNSLAWNSQVYPYTNVQTATASQQGVVKTYSTQADPVVFTTGDIDALSDLIGGGGGGSTKLDATNGVAVNLTGTVTQGFKPDSKGALSWGNDAPYLYSIGDSFTYGAAASTYANGYVQKLAVSLGIPATNIANGSFTISDATWSAFSGWNVTNSTGPGSLAFSSPSTITEDQNWTVLVGFNDTRTSTTTAAMFRKGLDHLIHWLSIPGSAKRTAQAPDSSTGTWTPIPWSNGMGSMGAYSSSGTLTFNNVIGNDIFVAYLGWGTNYGGTIALSIDGSSITNFSTASVAYGNRTYINGSDASIPAHTGPYGNGKIDFCPQIIRATDLGMGAHTVVVTASANPVYVLWCAGNGFSRTIRKGPNVFVGTIPRQSPWTGGGSDTLHASFNYQLQQAVLTAKASGLRVALAPTANDYLPASMQSGDGVHPTDAGHTAIAGAFEKPFSTDIPSIVSGASSAATSSGSGGSGSFTTLAVSGTSTLTGNATLNSRLLVLPSAVTTSGGYNSRFGYGSTTGSTISMNYGDSTLNRELFIYGDRLLSHVTSTGADAGMFLGIYGTTVGIEGGLTTVGVGQFNSNIVVNGTSTLTGAAVASSTLAVAGVASLNGGANFNKTLSSSSGTDVASTFAYTINQTGTAGSYGLFINPTQTALGSGTHRPFIIAPGGTNRFYVEQTGRPVIVSPNGTTGMLLRGDGATDSQILLQHAATLDRRLTLAGNSVTVTDAAGSVPQTLSLGTSGTTTAIQGAATVAQTLDVTGASSFTGTGTFNGNATVVGQITGTGGLLLSKTLSGSSGTDLFSSLSYTLNQTGTASSRGLNIALTPTALGSGSHRLINASVSGTDRFYIQSDGRPVVVSPNGTTGMLLRGDGGTDSRILFAYAATLDRQMNISGNQIWVRDANTGATANTLALGESTSTVAIQGNETVGGTTIIGTTGTTTGSVGLKGSTSGTVTLSVAAAAGTHTIKLPTADGTANQVLKTDGSGQWGWTTAGSGSVATDAIFTAKGDLAIGTGSSTSAKLTVGKNQEFIIADSSATTGQKWVPSTFGVPFGRQAWGSRMVVANATKEEGFTFAENSTTSGYTVSTASAPNFRTINTAATINTDAYIQINATGDCPYYGKRIIASGIFGLTTTSNVRAYLGLNSSGSAFGSDTAPNHSMMFRYSTSASDTTWHAVCKDGSTQNDVDTTVTADTSMHYFLIIYDYAASEIRYYIDNVLKVTLVSNLPVSGNQGFGCFGVRTLSGSAIGVKYSHIYVLNDQL